MVQNILNLVTNYYLNLPKNMDYTLIFIILIISISYHFNQLYIGSCLIILYYLRNWFDGPVTKLNKSMKRQIVIITGSSAGIGLETAHQLLIDGATVIFACRNKSKTEEIINSINDKKLSGEAKFLHLDLNNFSSITNFIKEFKTNFNRLDILINNAGLCTPNHTLTADGIETTLQSNTIGPIILTQGLLDILSKSSGRILNVSSRSYRNWNKDHNYYNSLSVENYNFEKKNYNGYLQYCYSKIGNIYFTQHLHEYITNNNLNIKVVSLHPGTVITDIAKDWTGIYTILKVLFYPILWFITKSPKMGAQTTLHLCYIDEKDFKSGEYYRDLCLYTLLNHAKSTQNRVAFMQLIKDIINKYGKTHNISFQL